MAGRQQEKKITTQFMKDVAKVAEATGWDFWYRKMDDMPAKALAEDGTPITRFVRKKPFDVIASVDGISVGIEFKFHGDRKPFPSSSLRPGQVEELIKHLGKTQKAVSLIAIANVYSNTAEVPGRSPGDLEADYPFMAAGRTQRIFIVTIQQWCRIVEAMDRKSIPIDTLLEHAEAIKRLKGARGSLCWDAAKFHHLVMQYSSMDIFEFPNILEDEG